MEIDMFRMELCIVIWTASSRSDVWRNWGRAACDESLLPEGYMAPVLSIKHLM